MSDRFSGPMHNQSMPWHKTQIGTTMMPNSLSHASPNSNSHGLVRCEAFAIAPPKNTTTVRMYVNTSATVSGHGYRIPLHTTPGGRV